MEIIKHLFKNGICVTKRTLAMFFFCLLFPLTTIAQVKSIRGTVVDERNEPLPGATIIVKNTNIATATDIDGNFTLSISNQDAVLIISFVGYLNQEITVGNNVTFNVSLKLATSELEEFVVVGYGVTKKETLSGSVVSVKGSEVIKSPAINVSNSLSGRVPGLTVVGQGGEPGNDFSQILVRGINTFKNSTPLFVVDGIPLQGSDKLQRIDPSVIESISVLKDASAAIYGSQGANGVILITTKRGQVGKTTVTASFNQGFSQPTTLPKMLNSFQIATLQNEALEMGYDVGSLTLHPGKYSVYDLAAYAKGDDPWHYANTNWIEEMIKPWTPQRYINTMVSSGTERIRGLVSFGTRFQDGFFKNGSSSYRQHDIRANLDFDINQYILYSLDVNGRFDLANFPVNDAGRIFSNATSAPPSRRAYWPDGTLGQPTDPSGMSGSPIAISTPLAGYNKSDNYVLNGTTKLIVKVPWVTGLSFTGSVTMDRVFGFGKYWSTPVSYYEWDGVSTSLPNFTEIVQGDLQRTLIENQSIQKNYLFNLLANYEKVINNHTIKLLYGYEQFERASTSSSIQRKGFDADNLDQMIFGTVGTEVITQHNPGTGRWKNHLGRANYGYKSKLLAEIVFRYQASSIFHKDNRWGFFPGASLAYRLSEEDFWKNNLPAFNDFKIRASWGKTGNDQVPPFQYLSLYTTPVFYYVQQVGSNGELESNTTLQESVASYVNATWEKANQIDLGFDASLLNNDLNITFDWFRNLRTDILTPLQGGLPSSTGIIPPDQNLARFINSGVDFNISYRNNDFPVKFNVSLNGLYAKNKYLFFDEVEGRPEYQQQTGHPMGAGLYYNVLGIFRTQEDLDKYPAKVMGLTPVLGDLIFEDKNEDGQVDILDQIRSYKTSIPNLSGGLNIGMNYNGIDLTVLFQGATSVVKYLRPSFSLDKNYLISFYEKRWTPDNINSEFPRFHSGQSAYWSNPNGVWNTFFLKDASYLRLKNIELGYTFHSQLLKNLNMQNLRVYMNALNLLTYAPGLKDWYNDPEESIRDQFYGESYPIQRVINFGINVTF